MNFISNIKTKDFDDFAKNNNLRTNFMQSYAWGELCEKSKNLTPHYVGIKEDNQLIAIALLLQKKLPLGFSYFYSPRGYIIDFNNYTLLEFFTKNIKKYVKNKKGIFIKIDPDIELHNIDDNANKMDDNFNNYHLIASLKNLGYTHLRESKGFESSQPRYTFQLDLTKPIEDIRKNIHSTTRKILNKNNPYGLEIKTGTITEIKEFNYLMKLTSSRNNFLCNDYNYYYHFYNILNNYNMSTIYYTTINIEDIIEKTKIFIADTKKQIEFTSDTSNGEKNDLISKLTKLKTNLHLFNQHQKEYPNNLLISAMIVVKHQDKIWTVHGGNHNVFHELNASYLMYYQILLDAKNDGYKIMDFFGTTGDPNNNNNIAGIHLFKKRFGGKYVEFIGEFDLIIYKIPYYIFTKIIPLYRRIKRKLLKFKRGKSI